jgi:hypothetical protein
MDVASLAELLHDVIGDQGGGRSSRRADATAGDGAPRLGSRRGAV